jgi:hypothetical protein
MLANDLISQEVVCTNGLRLDTVEITSDDNSVTISVLLQLLYGPLQLQCTFHRLARVAFQMHIHNRKLPIIATISQYGYHGLTFVNLVKGKAIRFPKYRNGEDAFVLASTVTVNAPILGL